MIYGFLLGTFGIISFVYSNKQIQKQNYINQYPIFKEIFPTKIYRTAKKALFINITNTNNIQYNNFRIISKRIYKTTFNSLQFNLYTNRYHNIINNQ